MTVLLCGFVGAGHAAVVWEQPDLRTDAMVQDDRVTARFLFRVTDHAVVFDDAIAPSCDCVSANIAPAQVAVGGTGELVATYEIGDQTGEQRVEIPVSYRVGDATPVASTIRWTVRIPSLISIPRKLVAWTGATTGTSQRLHCTVTAPYVVHTVSATSEHPAIAASATLDPSGRDMDITVSVVDAGHHAPVKVRVVTDLPVQRQASFALWVVNRPARP